MGRNCGSEIWQRALCENSGSELREEALVSTGREHQRKALAAGSGIIDWYSSGGEIWERERSLGETWERAPGENGR